MPETLHGKTAFTIDFESDWESENIEGTISVMPRLLEFLSKRRIKATFFINTCLLKNKEVRDVLREAGKRGHELASHGHTHRDLRKLPEREIEKEVSESKKLIESLGFECKGFRAPYFSVPENLFSMLRKHGYRYDSSACDSLFIGRGSSRLRVREPSRIGGITELPMAVFSPARLAFGLSFVRGFSPLSTMFLPKRPLMLYVHPCEFLESGPGKEVSFFVRQVYNRNRGERAWKFLSRMLDNVDSEFVTCREMAEEI